jgi:hypothetical protein
MPGCARSKPAAADGFFLIVSVKNPNVRQHAYSVRVLFRLFAYTTNKPPSLGSEDGRQAFKTSRERSSEVVAIAHGDANVEADTDVAAVAEHARDTNAGITALMEETDNVTVGTNQFFDNFAVSAADRANELRGDHRAFQLTEQIAQICACLLNAFDSTVSAVVAATARTGTSYAFMRYASFAGFASTDGFDILHLNFSGHLNSSFLES